MNPILWFEKKIGQSQSGLNEWVWGSLLAVCTPCCVHIQTFLFIFNECTLAQSLLVAAHIAKVFHPDGWHRTVGQSEGPASATTVSSHKRLISSQIISPQVLQSVDKLLGESKKQMTPLICQLVFCDDQMNTTH